MAVGRRRGVLCGVVFEVACRAVLAERERERCVLARLGWKLRHDRVESGFRFRVGCADRRTGRRGVAVYWLGVQCLLELCCGNGPAEGVALDELATDGAQRLPRFVVLDALCDYADAKLVGELDRSVDDCRIGGIGAHPRDEGTIDFDFPDGQRFEVRKRGVAGAEVI